MCDVLAVSRTFGDCDYKCEALPRMMDRGVECAPISSSTVESVYSMGAYATFWPCRARAATASSRARGCRA